MFGQHHIEYLVLNHINDIISDPILTDEAGKEQKIQEGKRIKEIDRLNRELTSTGERK